jgi:hypothetical protein
MLLAHAADNRRGGRGDCRSTAITKRHRQKRLPPAQARRDPMSLRPPLLIQIVLPFSPRFSCHSHGRTSAPEGLFPRSYWARTAIKAPPASLETQRNADQAKPAACCRESSTITRRDGAYWDRGNCSQNFFLVQRAANGIESRRDDPLQNCQTDSMTLDAFCWFRRAKKDSHVDLRGDPF